MYGSEPPAGSVIFTELSPICSVSSKTTAVSLRTFSIETIVCPPELISLLLRHNLVLDPLIGGSRKNLLLHQFILPLVRTALDDLLGVGIANSRERLELLGGGRVEVEEISLPLSQRRR